MRVGCTSQSVLSPLNAGELPEVYEVIDRPSHLTVELDVLLQNLDHSACCNVIRRIIIQFVTDENGNVRDPFIGVRIGIAMRP